MIKVLFINDSTSNPNWGDRAGAIALKKMILESGGEISEAISEEELWKSSFCNTSASSQGNRTRGFVRKILDPLVPPLFTKLKQKIKAHSVSASQDDIIPRKWEGFDTNYLKIQENNGLYSDFIRKFEQVDVIVINGNGCMMGINRVARAELFLSYLAKRGFGKSVIIVNHTADFEHPDLLEMAKEIYPLFDDVVFRDSISAERCRSLCNGRFVPDAGFIFEPIPLNKWVPVAERPTYFDVWPDTATFNPARPYICVGGSSLYPHVKGGLDAASGFCQLVDHLRSIYSGQIVLTVSDFQDQAMFRQVARRFNLPVIGLQTPVQQASDILGNAQAYIGGRWHPSIFALRGGTPVIPITSITFKMQALMEMAGLPTKTSDALNLEVEKLSVGKQLMEYLERGEELRNKLRAWALKESEKSWDNVSFLKQFSKQT